MFSSPSSKQGSTGSNRANHAPIFSMKISELTRLRVGSGRSNLKIKITGQVNRPNENALMLSNKKQVLLFSIEEESSMLDENQLLASEFEFDPIEAGSNRFETWVDVSNLEEFDFNNISPQHDIVQFIGYKDSSSTSSRCNFNAIFSRVIKRANLSKYYFALDVQNKFINERMASYSL